MANPAGPLFVKLSFKPAKVGHMRQWIAVSLIRIAVRIWPKYLGDIEIGSK